MKLGIVLVTFGSLLLVALFVLTLTGAVRPPWEMPSPVAATGRLIIGGLAALWCMGYGITRIKRAKVKRLVKKVLGDEWEVKEDKT